LRDRPLGWPHDGKEAVLRAGDREQRWVALALALERMLIMNEHHSGIGPEQDAAQCGNVENRASGLSQTELTGPA